MESGDCVPEGMCYDYEKDMYQYEVSSAQTESLALLTVTSCWLFFTQ